MPRLGAGFTLIEVMASLLVLSLALAGAIALIQHGLRMASLAAGRSTGMATAVSVAMDAAPLLDADATWNGSSGYINGYYVIREEKRDGLLPGNGLGSAAVKVTVYESVNGVQVAYFATRIVRYVK